MTDTPTPIPPDGGAYGGPLEHTVTTLARSVRRLRVWLVVLSAVVGLLVLASCGSLAMLSFTMGGFGMMEEEFPEGMLDSTRTTIEDSYGEKLEDLDVRQVEIEYGEPPFPISIMMGGGGGGESSVYVEYRLKGSEVVFANMLGMYGEDISSSGMLPLDGTLASRMTEEQFDRILVAYAAESRKPLGSIRRYNDRSPWMMDGEQVSDTVKMGDKKYPAEELWSLTEGTVIEGESFNVNENPNGFSRTAYVFHEDPTTGAFTFLGTEPTETMW